MQCQETEPVPDLTYSPTPPIMTQTPAFTVVTDAEPEPGTTSLPDPSTTDTATTPDIPDFVTTAEPTDPADDETTPPAPITDRYTAAGPSTQLPIELRQPTIKVHPRNVTVPKDSYAKFFCSATGSPSPHLVIVRADSNYAIPTFNKNQVSKGEESLPEVQQTIGPITEANEGWYECIAANYWGTVKSRAFLRVMDLCEAVDCKPPKSCVQVGADLLYLNHLVSQSLVYIIFGANIWLKHINKISRIQLRHSDHPHLNL